MEIFLAILLSALGILLIIYGGNWFVDAASWIARAANIPPFIIGATIVSFATTLPEMIVSLIASLQGKNDMAIGNAVGSVTANTGLILALALLFMTLSTPRKNYLKQCLLLIAACVSLWLGCLNGKLMWWANIILLLIFIISMIFNIKDARQETVKIDKLIVTKKDLIKHIMLFILGAAGIILGSNLLINGGSTLATAFGVPERVIAITMVAIGTSLPELVTTITAIRKHEANLSAGNIIGANIIDLTLILPICSLVAHDTFSVSTQCLQLDFPACVLISLIAVTPMICKQRTYKWQGLLLISSYILYLVISF